MINKNYYDKDDFKKIINCLPGMAYQCLDDKKWTMKFVSKGCKNLTGYSSEEIIDNKIVSFSSLVINKHKNKVRQIINDAVKNNNIYTIEYQLMTKSKNKKWVWEQGAPVYNKEGGVKYLVGFITDITDQRSKNRELRETKERFELAIKGAKLGIWDWNIKTGHITINDNWAEMLGYKKEEIEPNVDEWDRMIHDDDRELVYKKLNEHIEGKTDLYEVEHRLETKDGNYKWIRDIGKIFQRDKNGKPIRAVGIHINIEDRKQAERKIREKERKFRTYIENAPIGVYVTDQEGKLLEVNKHAINMTGYTEEELLNMSLHNLSEIKEKEMNYLLRKFKKDGRIEIEGRFKKKDGKIFNARINGVVIDNNKYLGFVENIDKQVKMKTRLKKQKAYFEQLFNESTEGIVLLNNKGTVLKVNDYFLKIFGYNRDEVTGNNIDDLITPEEKKNEGIYYTDEVIDGQDIKEESVRIRKDGKKIHVSIHAFPIKLDQGQIGIYGIYNDITERKRQEQKRKYLSFHDQLTGLYNRRYFENELERYNDSRKIPISIIISDIDNLKVINDNFGHRAGDKHIKSAADIFNSVIRKEDIVARIGGDEFAIILPETNELETKKIINRIIERIKTFNEEASNILSLSIGYSVKEQKDQDIEKILKEADDRMYRRKRKKKQSG